MPTAVCAARRQRPRFSLALWLYVLGCSRVQGPVRPSRRARAGRVGRLGAAAVPICPGPVRAAIRPRRGAARYWSCAVLWPPLPTAEGKTQRYLHLPRPPQPPLILLDGFRRPRRTQVQHPLVPHVPGELRRDALRGFRRRPARERPVAPRRPLVLGERRLAAAPRFAP